MCRTKLSGLLLNVVSKRNNLLAQNGGNVSDGGVGLGKGLDLQAVGKIDEHTLLVPKLFRLERINEDFITVMTCMPCCVQRLPWEPNKKKKLIYCLCTYFEWFCADQRCIIVLQSWWYVTVLGNKYFGTQP